MVQVLIFAAFAASPAETPERRDEPQVLAARFERDGFSTSRESADGDFDGLGNAFVASGLPPGRTLAVRSDRFGAVEFRRPPLEALEPNMVPCRGQEISIRTKRIFNVLFSLGAAHHGIQSGWIEFRFEDGTVGYGPFGFTDWAWDPALGEEEAFALQVSGPLNLPPERRFRLWLQRTPIPAEKRLVALRLPEIPNAKVVGLTLGYRDGVRPAEPTKPPKADPGPVAIFSEPGFPYYNARAGLTPERIRTALAAAGIGSALLGIDHLRDPEVFRAEAYPVLVNPYGNAFPADAEENLRAYRRSGGSFVHLGVPCTHPVVRTAYGSFFDPGHTEDLLRHEGDRALGAGGFLNGPWKDFRPEPALEPWNFGGVAWDRFLPRGSDIDPHFGYRAPQTLDPASLDPGDEVVPLLSLAGFDRGPAAAIVRHRSCAFAGAIDVWAGPICLGGEPAEAPVALAAEFLARGAAWILREKKLLGEAAWEAIARPVPEALRAPEKLQPVRADGERTWRLPEVRPAGKRVLRVDVRALSASERILAASAQGLVNRSGGEESVYLADGEAGEARLEAYREAGAIEGVRAAGLAEVLERVGHRRAVVVDPDVRGSLNVATMLAAAEGLLVAHPWNLEPHRLEAAEDLRGRFASAAEGYAWAEEKLLPRLSSGILAMVEPAPSTYAIRDYLIAARVFTFWVSSEAESAVRGASAHRESAFASRLLARTPVLAPVLAPPLPSSGSAVRELLARFGKTPVPVARLGNLSLSSGLRHALALPARSEAPPPRFERGKVYVACVAPWEPEAALGGAGPGPVPAGRLLPPYAADLLPVEAARTVAALGPRGSLGTDGLGDVDWEGFGGAFGEKAAELRREYLAILDRGMKDLGHRFLVLPRWRARKEASIAQCARVVRAAEIILPGFQAASILPPETACYALGGKPVVHTSLRDFGELASSEFGGTPYAAARPAFAWVLLPSGRSSLPADLAKDVVLVDPVELAALLREHAAESGLEEVALVPAGAVWRYHDRGEDLGTPWREPDFDDASWPSGPAELGYGDDAEGRPEATALSFGDDPKDKPPCVYFRIRFAAKDARAAKALALEVLADDGCIAYLNGQEVGRWNMSPGEATYRTYALRAISDEEETIYRAFEVDPGLLREGENVLAVEVHQSNPSSSDLSFDARLTLRRALEPGR